MRGVPGFAIGWPACLFEPKQVVSVVPDRKGEHAPQKADAFSAHLSPEQQQDLGVRGCAEGLL